MCCELYYVYRLLVVVLRLGVLRSAADVINHAVALATELYCVCQLAAVTRTLV